MAKIRERRSGIFSEQWMEFDHHLIAAGDRAETLAYLEWALSFLRPDPAADLDEMERQWARRQAEAHSERLREDCGQILQTIHFLRNAIAQKQVDWKAIFRLAYELGAAEQRALIRPGEKFFFTGESSHQNLAERRAARAVRSQAARDWTINKARRVTKLRTKDWDSLNQLVLAVHAAQPKSRKRRYSPRSIATYLGDAPEFAALKKRRKET